MLWAVHLECPSGVWFAFNCYRHWVTLFISAGEEKGHFLFSKEGVNQGDLLAAVVCGLGILPLICELQQSHPGVTQPWYADGAEAGGTFEGIQRNLDWSWYYHNIPTMGL